MTLIIGDKKFSSWSLRPWLLMKQFDIPFDERLVSLYRRETREEILRHSPAGLVPVLLDEDLAIWDSMAIHEYLAEKYPDKNLWPADRASRALARSVSAEMHSGFATMREHLSHNVVDVKPGFDWRVAEKDIRRVCDLWTDCLRKSGGPFLFGKFSIADAMFAPVVNRFIGYDVRLEEVDAGEPALIKKHMDEIRALPAHVEWIEEARAKDNASAKT